ncbi:expressed unknown protein [Seminavis robusta]|uniref:Uncharacterized protein n=1 Tax=Seminavis robusta TaxID=568900 RepID=A0A9N8D443_9STRA|nr:expressed unknown protein [Seminavis robusta]|eukprot:Sro1_g000170.1 n/a (130) ;mRNA; r:63012-63401
MWPGVYTVNSCSGVHAGAWMEFPDHWFCEDYIKFVSDDREALNQVSAILETGSLGIKFMVCNPQGMPDNIGSKEGFLVIDYQDNVSEAPKTCRTYCRAMSFVRDPTDKLDSMLHVMARALNKPPRVECR